MPSQRQLKGRIRSVKNTKQITKAMQMVAASKMRRAQDATKATAPYTQTAREILGSLSRTRCNQGHPLFEDARGKKAACYRGLKRQRPGWCVQLKRHKALRA